MKKDKDSPKEMEMLSNIHLNLTRYDLSTNKRSFYGVVLRKKIRFMYIAQGAADLLLALDLLSRRTRVQTLHGLSSGNVRSLTVIRNIFLNTIYVYIRYIQIILRFFLETVNN